ncbi:Crp/Fnr family transcriptional regulator [Sphingorhabdus soli]|uniref:Crp/Fnr family transcriptional regulator n=1 Tax=Flavisphingopyxis soli TaxID=2601267 RepID=A0A5C6UM76_9SPHN|nr:Crp/Fnr family transcriptional regulator [Sphingorhabdus soli]TXC73644.1 Crp/Fnr family transcriptional regulator [Sphingorhabdus soli]
MSGSCFAEHLSHFVALSESERTSLARLEERERAMKRGEFLQREGDEVEETYIVKHGRLMGYVVLDGGSRQILRHYYAGDTLAASNTIYRNACETIVAIDDAVVCPIDKDGVRGLLEEHPRVAAVLFALNQAERVTLTDRLASIGRTPAKARIAAILLDVLFRLRLMKNQKITEFDPRMTQEEMGDATGLTSVHVNRMMRELDEDGLIKRDGSTITVIDEPGLCDLAHYQDRFADLDFSWLPAARS